MARRGSCLHYNCTNMATVRIAVAGAGAIGQRHIEEIVRSGVAKLAAIVDVSSRAAAVARSNGVALYASLHELFQRDRPDGVVLATPNALHVDQALQCIDHGIPVLVEKPVAHTY